MATKKVTSKNNIDTSKVIKSFKGSHKVKESVVTEISKNILKLSFAIIAIVVIFSPENTWILGPIIGALAIMGISLGYFASK